MEVDLSHSSLPKFPIYHSLQIRELWRFDGNAMTFHHLTEDAYIAREQSLHFPRLDDVRKLL